jgi:anti-sigma regulatory factor (Ser/Thr protein kinase)
VSNVLLVLAFESASQAQSPRRRATAIFEIGRNSLRHAGRGAVSIAEAADDDLLGIEVVARDRGPVTADVEQALSERLGERSRRHG